MSTSPSSDALLVFARYPRLGRVKTRLRQLLSPQQCLEVYCAFLFDTLQRTARLNATRYLFLADCSNREAEDFARAHELSSRFRIRTQRGDDLGDRMWNALSQVSPRPDRVVFVGSDTPSLPLAYIRMAFERLKETPVVIGPVDDGGYYLLALAQWRRELFYGIEWGTETVLRQTLSRLHSTDFVLLPRWYDVDTAEDLRRLKQDLIEDFEGVPQRTRGLLDSLALKPGKTKAPKLES